MQKANGKDDALTARIASACHFYTYSALPATVVGMVKDCLLDTIGVGIAAVHDEGLNILKAQVQEEAAPGPCNVIGDNQTASAGQAALINGTACHTLDYDDVNSALNGHPSAVLVPAVLALGQKKTKNGREIIESFVAGYEAACELGVFLQPEHYKRGFHNTATIGTLAAAQACSRLLGLDAAQTAMALSIASTQAAGLRYLFGTMCKPVHAGFSARNGLFAAELAGKGFTGRGDTLEAEIGFAASHGTPPKRERTRIEPPSGFYLLANQFKNHAACFSTHPAIEAAKLMRATVPPHQVYKATLYADAHAGSICNIQDPTTHYEAKFSLRHVAALALGGVDTASLDAYSDTYTSRPDIVALRNRIEVKLVDSKASLATLEVRKLDGSEASISYDAAVSPDSRDVQSRKVMAKFLSLASPVVGSDRAQRIAASIQSLEQCKNISELMKLV